MIRRKQPPPAQTFRDEARGGQQRNEDCCPDGPDQPRGNYGRAELKQYQQDRDRARHRDEYLRLVARGGEDSGRKKSAPAFDAFDLSAGENNEFGAGTTQSRHFTEYSLKNDTTGVTGKRLESDIPEKLDLMNPMYHLEKKNPGRARHWWIRLGTKDSDTSLTVSANLTAALDNLGDKVNHLYYWDEGHGANIDAADFIRWIAKVTGRRAK